MTKLLQSQKFVYLRDLVLELALRDIRVRYKKSVLGSYTNSKTQNILGLIILAITIFLGAKGILKVFNIL